MTRLVYIMGHGLSGSTLLTFLLGAHPEIATVGELVIAPKSKEDPDALVCSCGAPYLACPFWQHVSRAMGERGHPFHVLESGLDFRAPSQGFADVALRASLREPWLEIGRRLTFAVLPGPRRELHRLLRRYEAFVEVVTGTKGCGTFVDSSKRPERAIHLLHSRNLDVRVIHLIRDGRAVAASAMKHWGYGPEQAAISWLTDNTESERARHYFPAGRWMRLRHEDVCADPHEALARVHAFIGVSARPEIGDFRADQHIIGNSMRLRSTTEITLDERWKTALKPADLETIDSRLGVMNRRYGYWAL